jgi:hypothetical protein
MPTINPDHGDAISGLIVKDLRYPPPGVVLFVGYLGKALKRPPEGTDMSGDADADKLEPAAATEDYWRLYTNDQFNEYIEFRDADVVAYRKEKEPSGAGLGLNQTYVWLTEAARIDHVRVARIQLHRGFLQGDIADTEGSLPGQGLARGVGHGSDPFPPACSPVTVLPPCRSRPSP